jgi:hypothetical protein
MPKKVSCIRSTKGSGGSTHKGHRGEKGMPTFHGKCHMLQLNFNWHEITIARK